jgi:cell wall-associated NlpC family hydrolase
MTDSLHTIPCLLAFVASVAWAEQPAETPRAGAAPAPATVLPAEPTPGERALEAGRAYLGEPWAWGGRATESHPGIGCMGLVFRAWGSVQGRSWRSYEVNPSELVAGGKLGRPVPGLDGILRGEVDVAQLEPGDVIYFLLRDYEIPDAPLWSHEGHDYWPWHMGLYAGDGRALHADPSSRVRHQRLEHVSYDALYVTRP